MLASSIGYFLLVIFLGWIDRSQLGKKYVFVSQMVLPYPPGRILQKSEVMGFKLLISSSEKRRDRNFPKSRETIMLRKFQNGSAKQTRAETTDIFLAS
jgi:hypothetical protein